MRGDDEQIQNFLVKLFQRLKLNEVSIYICWHHVPHGENQSHSRANTGLFMLL